MKQHVLIAVRKSTWQDADPTKKQKIKTFLERFTDPDANAISPVTYIHTATSNEVFVACYWTEHLKRWREYITDAKIATVKAALADAEIRIEPTDNPQATLAGWGLEAPQVEDIE